MIRIIKQNRKFYGLEVDISSNQEQDNIDALITDGTPVILVNEIKDVLELDINPDDIEMIG